jgi:hypothetical protein
VSDIPWPDWDEHHEEVAASAVSDKEHAVFMMNKYRTELLACQKELKKTRRALTKLQQRVAAERKAALP